MRSLVPLSGHIVPPPAGPCLSRRRMHAGADTAGRVRCRDATAPAARPERLSPTPTTRSPSPGPRPRPRPVTASTAARRRAARGPRRSRRPPAPPTPTRTSAPRRSTSTRSPRSTRPASRLAPRRTHRRPRRRSGTGGNTPGVASGNSLVFYGKDALLGGFDWFEALTGWFPQVLGSSGANSPGHVAVDMAYAPTGTLTFNDVVVPTSRPVHGRLAVRVRVRALPGRYQPADGARGQRHGHHQHRAFPDHRQLRDLPGFVPSGAPERGEELHQMFAVDDHGVSRVDEMTIIPATASVPSGPTNLTSTSGTGPSRCTGRPAAADRPRTASTAAPSPTARPPPRSPPSAARPRRSPTPA